MSMTFSERILIRDHLEAFRVLKNSQLALGVKPTSKKRQKKWWDALSPEEQFDAMAMIVKELAHHEANQ